MDTTDRHGTPLFAIAASFDSASLISPINQARVSRFMNPPLRLAHRLEMDFLRAAGRQHVNNETSRPEAACSRQAKTRLTRV